MVWVLLLGVFKRVGLKGEKVQCEEWELGGMGFSLKGKTHRLNSLESARRRAQSRMILKVSQERRPILRYCLTAGESAGCLAPTQSHLLVSFILDDFAWLTITPFTVTFETEDEGGKAFFVSGLLFTFLHFYPWRENARSCSLTIETRLQVAVRPLNESRKAGVFAKL